MMSNIITSPDRGIVVQGLKKSYHNLKVLDGVDLEVKTGSIFALLGANGAGKTTTVKILATLVRPDKGMVRVFGFDLGKEPEQVRRVISLTGQYAAVDELLTGRENLRLIGRLRHVPAPQQRADELLARFNLTAAADRRVATYSGGMRRRLDLAMSLVGDPAIIFLDEPTTGLDPQSRLAMWQLVRALAQAGVTIFLTTQYLEEADQLADHIAILNAGKIVAQGTAAALKGRLPHGYIELSFDGQAEMQRAYDLFRNQNATASAANQSITVATDGSVKQITELLGRLEQEQIQVKTFSQKQPTLEDVFLELIGESRKKEKV
jgi:ABC-2 type transport system ATP-binding protein